MDNYEQFAPFYDAVMGDRKKSAQHILRLVRQHNPKARNVLELACGTGSVLQHFGTRYELYGLDLSSKMLAIAKKKVPRASLYRQNMTSFSLPEKFDVIFCIFDSINHVLSFSGWTKVFGRAYDHLTDGGVLIFDINTQRKLNRLAAAPTWFHPFGANFLAMKVTIDGKGVSNWNVKIFERIKRGSYALHEENIKEASFPEDRIVRALKARFRTVKVIDLEPSDSNTRGERLDFICKSSRQSWVERASRVFKP